MLLHSLRIALNVLRGSMLNPPTSLPYTARYVCWPTDIDVYLHMNNSSYLRIAEYARWKMYAQSGLAGKTKGAMFLVVENNAKYKKPINPFQAFTISTDITSSDDKWLHYTHTFTSTSSPETVYAVVEAKAVWKQANGKTINVSSLAASNDFAKLITSKIES